MADIPQSFLGLLMTVLYLLTGVSGETLSMFSRMGDNVSLPCNNVVYPNCSSTTWLYNRDGSTGDIEEVTLGKIKVDQTERAERLSLGSNCSLHVSDVRAEDVGLYTCRQYLTETGPQHGGDAPVHLSVLTISSTTAVTDLKPNVIMTLRCSLLTYTQHGTCRSGFSLSWVPKTGTNSQNTQDSSCDITLTVTLQKKDNNRKWTCTLTEKGNMKISIDFTSTFSDIEEKTTDNDDVISTLPGSTASTTRPALSTTSPSSAENVSRVRHSPCGDGAKSINTVGPWDWAGQHDSVCLEGKGVGAFRTGNFWKDNLDGDSKADGEGRVLLPRQLVGGSIRRGTKYRGET
ncbi:uncharacterized protein LOC115126197 isoform X3 [Oncorhynchus nerka]|uniref:uncharacterized protein LOC115126197 isoform X3 n=1 Tax=Oncorhynchus nerka TaxID=8023 RepID=UPI0031B822CC